MIQRLYQVWIKDADSPARFTRRSRRSVIRELALLAIEYPKARQIEVRPIEPARERMVPGMDGLSELFAPAVQS